MTVDDQKKNFIQDQEHLDSFVYRWSTDRGLDPVKYSEIARNLFPNIQNHPISEDGAGSMLNHFRGRIDEEIKNTLQTTSLLLPPASAWGLEVAKHLAIVNTTGVAGSAALATQFHQQADFRNALISFAIGILISFVTLWLGSQTFLALLKQMPKRLTMLKSASNWDDYGAALNAVSMTRFKITGIATTIFGVFATGAAAWGTVLIIRALCGMSA